VEVQAAHERTDTLADSCALSGGQDARLYGRPEALRYGRMEKIHFEDAHFRRDGAAWGL